MLGSMLISNSSFLSTRIDSGILRVGTDNEVASNTRTVRPSTSVPSGMSSTGKLLKAGLKRKLKGFNIGNSIKGNHVLRKHNRT